MNVHWVFWVIPLVIVIVGFAASFKVADWMANDGDDAGVIGGGCAFAFGILATLLLLGVYVAGGLMWGATS